MDNNICKNCETKLHGSFCFNCGQKVFNEKDKSFIKILHEIIRFITNFDGKIINTIKAIYRNPGRLSIDYCNGKTQRYYKPLSLYLLIVLVYLLFPLASGLNMEMKYYKGTPLLGKYIVNKIDKMAKAENISEDTLSVEFGEKSKSLSKFSLLLLIPLSAPLLYLLYFNKKRFFYDNFILLTEINIFFLLTIFIIIPLFIFPFSYLLKVDVNDSILLPISFIIFSIYCMILFHKIFKEKLLYSVLKGSLFCLLFIVMIITIYRVIVFEIIFATL